MNTLPSGDFPHGATLQSGLTLTAQRDREQLLSRIKNLEHQVGLLVGFLQWKFNTPDLIKTQTEYRRNKPDFATKVISEQNTKDAL